MWYLFSCFIICWGLFVLFLWVTVYYLGCLLYCFYCLLASVWFHMLFIHACVIYTFNVILRSVFNCIRLLIFLLFFMLGIRDQLWFFIWMLLILFFIRKIRCRIQIIFILYLRTVDGLRLYSITLILTIIFAI